MSIINSIECFIMPSFQTKRFCRDQINNIKNLIADNPVKASAAGGFLIGLTSTALIGPTAISLGTSIVGGGVWGYYCGHLANDKAKKQFLTDLGDYLNNNNLTDDLDSALKNIIPNEILDEQGEIIRFNFAHPGV